MARLEYKESVEDSSTTDPRVFDVQPEQASLHDFPDRIIGRLQSIPAHLRELVQAVMPQIADRVLFEKAEPLQNKMQLPDWRRLESDLLFEVPVAKPADVHAALICLLVENQMKGDQAMPLRTLLYAVFYWERQWRAWEAKHARKQTLRLNPVLPIILHTGSRPWKTNRTMADLFAGPEILKPSRCGRRFSGTWQRTAWTTC